MKFKEFNKQRMIIDESIKLNIDELILNNSTIDLFDGYLGEQKEIPNPLEYGPNATYRNLSEGKVYRKNSENLWEVFLQDGKPGKQGQSLGSGVGVEEVKRLIVEHVGITDMGSYALLSKPIMLSNGILFSPFTQRYISGVPSVSSMTISAGISQRINLPTGTSYRIWWYGVGPFAYRTGDFNVISTPSDFPANVGYTQILNTTDEYLAVNGA